MGLIEAYRKHPLVCWLTLAAVVVTTAAAFGLARSGGPAMPGFQMQVIQLVLAICAAAVFAYAIRPGKSRAGWLLWWIPVVLTVVSIPIQQMLPGLVARDATLMMQIVLFASLAWLAILAAPLTWLAIYLPWEFAVRAVRGFAGGERKLAVAQLAWGALIGAATLGAILAAVLWAPSGQPGLVSGTLSVIAAAYPGLGALMEIVLLFGPPILTVIALIAFVVTFVWGGGRARLAEAAIIGAPFFGTLREARRRNAEPSDDDQVPKPATSLPSGAAWSPLWLWKAAPGGVLLSISTAIVTFAVAMLGNSQAYLHHVLMPLDIYIGPFAWGTVLAILSGANLAMVMSGRHFRTIWTLVWLALAVTLMVAGWLAATDPSFGVGEWFMVAFIAVITTALSCLSWLFLVVPLQSIAGSVLGLFSGAKDSLGGLLLGLCLGFGGVAIVTGFLGVDTRRGNQAAILAALLGRPGDYRVESEPLLWAARIAILAMVAFGLLARFALGGRGALQKQLSDTAMGPSESATPTEPSGSAAARRAEPPRPG